MDGLRTATSSLCGRPKGHAGNGSQTAAHHKEWSIEKPRLQPGLFVIKESN